MSTSWVVCLWLVTLVVLGTPEAGFAADIYVSPGGGTQADGSPAKPHDAHAVRPISEVQRTFSWYKGAEFGRFIHFDVRVHGDSH